MKKALSRIQHVLADGQRVTIKPGAVFDAHEYLTGEEAANFEADGLVCEATDADVALADERLIEVKPAYVPMPVVFSKKRLAAERRNRLPMRREARQADITNADLDALKAQVAQLEQDKADLIAVNQAQAEFNAEEEKAVDKKSSKPRKDDDL